MSHRYEGYLRSASVTYIIILLIATNPGCSKMCLFLPLGSTSLTSFANTLNKTSTQLYIRVCDGEICNSYHHNYISKRKCTSEEKIFSFTIFLFTIFLRFISFIKIDITCIFRWIMNRIIIQQAMQFSLCLIKFCSLNNIMKR